jgi:hypothetical protein
VEYVYSYAVQIGWPEIAFSVGLFALALLGVWKLAKVIWAASSG